jgi:hypothetical protein
VCNTILVCIVVSLTVARPLTTTQTTQDSDYYEYDVEDLNDGYGGHSYINGRFGSAYNNNRYSSNNSNNNSEKAKLLALQRGRYDPQTVSTCSF